MSDKVVYIERGNSGWGGPLYLKKEGKKTKILSMTSAGIEEVTERIAEMLDAEIVDGFKTGVPDDELIAVVIDCGGTARCGVYPKKKISTINVKPVGKSGPLANFITEEYYVSDVSIQCLTEMTSDDIDAMKNSGSGIASKSTSTLPTGKKKPENYDQIKKDANAKAAKGNIILRIGQGAGHVVGKFNEAGRETIGMVMNNVLPFMAFVSMLIGLILGSGLGNVIANVISPFAGTFLGLLLISVVCTLPFLSPILGPGAVIAQVVGTLVGSQIGLGAIPAYLALPALFAINGQVGCDFVPVGLSLGEAEPETIEFGVPAVYYSRMITGPLSVIIAYVVALLVFK